MIENNKLRKYIFNRMRVLSGSLSGVVALLQYQDKSACYDTEELFSIRQFLKSSSTELSKIEDTLRSGRDSALEEVLGSLNL